MKRSSVALAAAVATVTLAIAVTSEADAHFGGLWYTTAASADREIEAAFYTVEKATCKAFPAWERATYHAHSTVDRFDVRRWDHFKCGIWAFGAGDGCWAVYHATGRRSGQFVMTSYPSYGCGPRTFRRG